jgi:membrane associated rhomboid family serine protease
MRTRGLTNDRPTPRYVSFLRRTPLLKDSTCKIIRVPAWIFLPVWFFLQISMGLKQHGSNVAFWAHVGGFLAGVIIAIAMYNYLPQRERSARQRI